MAGPVAAAAGAALKQLAIAALKRKGWSLFGAYWKAIAIGAIVLILAPIGMVVVAFVALAHSFAGGSAIVTGYAADPALRGPLGCPVPGAVVTQGFGPTSVAVEPPGFGYPHFHTGIDLAAPLGTPVYAASAGYVEVAGSEVDALGIPVGYGNYVELAVGNGEEQIYGHLSEIAVVKGDVVPAGALIGLVGSTGNSTGPHLHFEVRLHGRPVDPSGAVRC